MSKITTKQIKAYHNATQELLDFINSIPKKEYMKDYRECEIYLTRTRWFLQLLGNPEKRIPHYVHIAGTSGKGSTTQMVHEILLAAGKHVGSTYSPHPTTIIERFRVDDQLISVPEYMDLCRDMMRALRITAAVSPYGMISFFELMFCMTVEYFARTGVEHAVIEVGCGGRFGASNVIPTPDVTVITNIGWDHMDLLGHTLPKIAWEKAGIIKEGTIFITGEKRKSVLKVFKEELKKFPAKKELYVDAPTSIEVDLDGTTFKYKKKEYRMEIIGAHQAQNAALAIETAQALRISQKHIAEGLKNLKRPTCMEIIARDPLIIIDSAHNEDKMKSTAGAIKKVARGDVHLIIGIAENKRLKKIMDTISPLATKVYTTRFTKNSYRAAAKPSALSKLAKRARSFADPKKALAAARKNAKPQDTIIITGSIFLAGELREEFVSEKQILEKLF